MHPVEEFPYSHTVVSRKARVLITVLLFFSAAFFLWWGDSSSLAEPRHGTRLSDEQNLAVNLLCAFVLAVFGFLNLFNIWKNKTDGPISIVVSEDSIVAPEQGVSSRLVEIQFSDVTRMKKLSIDGVWEFNLSSRNKHIRVPKARLEVPTDFGRLIASAQKQVTGCELETEERINPPELSS